MYKIVVKIKHKYIFRYLWRKKSTSSWIKEVQKDLDKNNIHAEKAIDREVFRAKVLKVKGVQGLSLIHI